MAHLSFFFFGPRRVALDPLHEPAQRMLMLLYAQAGQQRAAMRQFSVNSVSTNLPGSRAADGNLPVAMALLLADQGEAAQAVEFYAAALQSSYIRNSRWFADVAGRHIETLTATLPPKTIATAETRGRARPLADGA